MNLIARHLRADAIVLDATCANKKRAFEQLAQLFEDRHGLARSAAFDALFVRERMGSTGLGEGVAIPHGRVKGLKDTLCAVMRLAEPIPFEAPDNAPVRLLVALMVPENANQAHLDLLGELAQMMSQAAFRQLLLSAADASSVHKQFLLWQPDALGGSD